MQNTKVLGCLVVLLCSCYFLSAQKISTRQTGFHLRNAYELSGWLYKADKNPNNTLTRDEKEKLIGSLIWYANLQDESDFSKLESTLGHYPSLSRVYKSLIKEISSVDTFFKMKISVNDELLRTIDKAIVRNKILEFNQRFFQEEAEKKRLESVYREFSYRFPIETASLLSSIATCDSMVSIFKADSIQFSSQNDTSSAIRRKEVDKSLSDSRIAISSFKHQIVELNTILAGHTTRLSIQEQRLNTLKTEIERYIKEHENDLVKFLVALNGGDIEGSKSDNKAYATAYYKLSHDDDYNVQSNMYLLEAQKYQGLKLPSQTDAIEAVAIYLANRIKQESVMWFFETITRNVDRYKLVNNFFPTTIKLLQGNESYEIPNLGAQWRYSLSKDFMEMPRNILLGDWLSSKSTLLSSNKVYFTGACDIAELILKRYTYKDAIRSLYMSYNTNVSTSADETQFSFKHLISFLYAVNTELFIPDTAQSFRSLGYEDFRSMPSGELEMMVSLIDLKYNQVFRKMFSGMADTLKFSKNINADYIRQLLGSVDGVIKQIEAASVQFVSDQKKMQQNGDQKDWFYNTYNVWGAFSEMIRVLSKDESKEYMSDGFKQSVVVLSHVQNLFEIYNLLSKKNFSGAVLNTISLVEKLVYDSDGTHVVKRNNTNEWEQFSDISFMKNLKDALDSKPLATAKDSIKRIWEKKVEEITGPWGIEYSAADNSVSFKQTSLAAAFIFEKDRHALQMVRKLSGFLNDVAMAQDDKQLAKVVESYAMPVGSYKRKRNNWASLDINAFAGGYIGYENAKPQPNDPLASPNSKNVKNGWVWGLSVPIGISYSTVLREKNTKNMLTDELIQNPDRLRFKKDGKLSQLRSKSTLTITASIIDLGAIVSYRLLNSSDKPLGQDFKWTQFISPGLHFSFAINSTPLVLNFGAQYTPQLRKFEENGVPNEKQFNAARIYTGLFFDLPLFNLWEKKHFQ